MNSTNNSSSLEEETEIGGFSNSTSFMISIIMLIFCIVGAYGNLISIVIFSHRTMKAPINVLLKALSIIDTILILSSIVVFILPNLNLIFQNASLRSACEFGSLYLYPISMTAQTCSVWTFVMVSCERYLAVCEPLKRHKLLTCRQARMAQLILLITALSYNFIRFWEYERLENDENTGLAPVVPLLRFRPWYFLCYYVLLYVITHFLIPFAMILILNAYIIKALREPRNMVPHRPGSTESRSSSTNYPLRKFSRRQSRQRQTTQMMVVITLMFAICNTLPFLINIVEAVDESLFYGPWHTVAYIALDVSNILVVFNSGSTFFIYLLYCSKYRILFVRYGLGNCWIWTSKKQVFRARLRSRSSDNDANTDYASIGTIEDAGRTFV